MNLKNNWKKFLGVLLTGVFLLGNVLPVNAAESVENAAAQEEHGTIAEESDYVPGEILIGYKSDVEEDAVEEAAEELDGEVLDVIAELEDETIALVSISDEMTVEAAIEEYTSDPAIEYAEPNYILELCDGDVGTFAESTSDQWYLEYMNASDAWDALSGVGGTTVRMALIDTGANIDHEDLKNVINTDLSVEIISRGANHYTTQSLRGDGYLNGGSTRDTSVTHGTHVAGIIAAQSGNDVGIQGVASGGSTDIQNNIVDLVVIDAFTSESTSVGEVVYAMQYAQENGCQVINLSMGTTSESAVLESACDSLASSGITIVCAAGNNGNAAAVYPSDYDSTISVINIQSDGTISSSSDYGDAKDISAPGTDIYSTLSTGTSAYGEMSGTSMASPMVAAAAAMLLYADPDLSPGEIKSILCETATELGEEYYYGAGAVNISAAVNAAIESAETDNGSDDAESDDGSDSTTTVTGTTVYNGVDYAAVYDYNYYISKYSDLSAAYGSDAAAALAHFVTYGMSEGRQAISTFNVTSYRYAYQDLRLAYGMNLKSYYLHYIYYGKSEGRTATGVTELKNPVTSYGGVNYSAVYSYSYYSAKYSDLRAAYGDDDVSMLNHFISCGMNEGRRAISTFNVTSYRYAYQDLRLAYGMNLKSYYLHYIYCGKSEGRTATGVTELQNPVTSYGGVNYSAVYSYSYYSAKYSDLRAAYGDDDVSMLKHFIACGMTEGRRAISTFNVSVYRSRYADLRAAFGSNLKLYYLHYINYGKSEGRTAV